MAQHYTAFISYRHQSPDQEVAKWLHTAIETYRIPDAIRKQTGQKSMGKCFRDAEELPLAPSLGNEIERALLDSDWLIAVCSPRYLQSRWCMQEIEFFAAHKGRDRILIVLAEGHPAESIPELLRWRYNENGERVPYEPLAAEARGATMGERVRKLKTEKFRILAPILGVGFDDLRRRARQRRIRMIAGAVAAMIAAGSALGIYVAANHAKNERLRREAEEQQLLAEEQERLAKQESLRAAENSIGEYLERAAAQLGGQERVSAANSLLDALKLSESNGGLRRDEIIAALRKTMYIEPFAPIAGFSNRNTRLLDIVPSPDGRLAVGIENSNAAALIDLEENTLRFKVSVDNGQISELRFSPNGSRFTALCDMGRLVTVWNTADGSVAFSYTSEANQRYQIANAFFWTDADTLLVQDMEHFYLVSSDGTKKLFYTMGDHQDWYDPEYNLLTMIFERSLEDVFTMHSDDYTGTLIRCTPDRSRMLVGGLVGETGMILLDGEGELVTPLKLMPGTIWEKYAVSDDGTTVACISAFGFVAGWDGKTGDVLYLYAPEVDSSYGGTYSVSTPVFSPDGKYLSYVISDTLFITDARSGAMLVKGGMASTNYTPELAYSSDGDYIFVTDQALYIVDAAGRLFRMLDTDASAPYNNVVQLGERMLITKGDGTAFVCCTPSAASIRSVGGDELPDLCEKYDPHIPPEGNLFANLSSEHELTEAFLNTTALSADQLVPKLWFSTDGRRAALSYADGVIEIFNTEDGGRVSTMLSQLLQPISALAMTESCLVVSDSSGRLMFYDLDGGAVINIRGSDSPCIDFAFNADHDKLMALRADDVIDVYDLKADELLFSMRSPERFTAFGFAEDGSCAAGLTASGALRAEMWTDEASLLAYAVSITGH